ncbi:MAG: hypothetical protein JNL47_07195 [Bacteroidia bacterium]|nr:hypothetical protein [Bacteroidia bacterium]
MMGFYTCSDLKPCPLHHHYYVSIFESIIRNLSSIITIAELASAVERGEAVLKKTQVALFS